ncbi:S-adenosyl-L-methionine-dependent methyltransferase [Thamnocephalis sphaerospora]|uniref:S-adenosyl-L-methionine-dependent methyltransferase n=1 Tax=Thamnocephalis sphaerospora TaxID=78915 RepID=A0A4P9XQ89_9FUNG|nr:S-adenosyl-L-methionine-dependent methyltransferase [Thamnocephalis sphaerospora]|eukprot:RKP08197.1 S-adenosyl-L-methionine-dependent methyltransferase [Thamnocephalis sphaerospora]
MAVFKRDEDFCARARVGLRPTLVQTRRCAKYSHAESLIRSTCARLHTNAFTRVSTDAKLDAMFVYHRRSPDPDQEGSRHGKLGIANATATVKGTPHTAAASAGAEASTSQLRRVRASWWLGGRPLTRHRSELVPPAARTGERQRARASTLPEFALASVGANSYSAMTARPQPYRTQPPLSPRDEEEMDRMDRRYELLRRVLGDNRVAPLDQLHHVLDVGTGSGVWLMEMASEWPSAQFTGVDLVAHFPSSVKPANCRFEQLDLLSGKSGTALASSIPAKKWPAICDDLYAVTAPGGWMELAEMEMQFHSVGPAGRELNLLLERLTDAVGVDIHGVARLNKLLPAAGYDSVERIVVSLPCGDWGGHVGRLFMEDCAGALRAVRSCILELGLVAASALDALYDAWRKELDATRCYGNMIIYMAQRPGVSLCDE